MLILSQIKILFQNKLTPPSSPLFQTSLILTKAFSQNWKNTSFPLKVLKFLPFSLNWFVLSPSFSFFPSSFSPFSLSYFPPFLPLLPSSPFFLSSSLSFLPFSPCLSIFPLLLSSLAFSLMPLSLSTPCSYSFYLLYCYFYPFCFLYLHFYCSYFLYLHSYSFYFPPLAFPSPLFHSPFHFFILL